MEYLKVYCLGKEGGSRGSKHPQEGKQSLFTTVLVMMIVVNLIFWSPIGFKVPVGKTESGRVRFAELSEVRSAAAARLKIKKIEYHLGKVSDWTGKSDLPLVFPIVDIPTVEGTEYTPYQFIYANASLRYFHPSVIGTVDRSRKYIEDKFSPSVIKKLPNHSSAFTVVPWKELYSEGVWEKGLSSVVRDHPSSPLLTTHKGMPKKDGRVFSIELDCYDGLKREAVFNEQALFLVPNIWGMFGEDSQELKPETALIMAMYEFTNLYDRKTAKWDMGRAKKFVRLNYNIIAGGVDLKPYEFEIVGKGMKSRLKYTGGNLGKNSLKVRWEGEKFGKAARFFGNKDEFSGPIVNQRGELCIYPSLDLRQCIIVPFQYVKVISDDEEMLFSDGFPTSYLEVLSDLKQVEVNKGVPVTALYSERKQTKLYSRMESYVVESERMREIANGAIGDAENYQVAMQRLHQYAIELPYTPDDKSEEQIYQIDIPMPPNVARLNGSGDCDKHATLYASLFLSADHPALGGMNDFAGLLFTTFTKNGKRAGHVNPVVPIPGKEAETGVFPNHIMFPVNGKNRIAFTVEATGHGQDKDGTTRLKQQMYRPKHLLVISRSNGGREVAMATSPEFGFLRGEKS